MGLRVAAPSDAFRVVGPQRRFFGVVLRQLVEANADATSRLLIPLHQRLIGKNTTGNTKGGSITVPLTSCLTGLDVSVLQIKTKNVSCHTADS